MWKFVVLAISLVALVYGVSDCVYDGVTYKTGDSFPSSDGCNTCGCTNGAVVCTERFCLNTNTTCTYGNETYNIGDSFKDLDGCNTCSCAKNGLVLCTLMACISGPGLVG